MYRVWLNLDHLKRFIALICFVFDVLRFTWMSNMTLNLLNENALRGAYKCSYAAALFVHVIHNVCRTDVECQWRKRKSSASLSSQAVSEMFPLSKKYTPLSRTLSNQPTLTAWALQRFEGVWKVYRPLLPPVPRATTCLSRTSHSHNWGDHFLWRVS